jgi:hypothetical protein
MQREISDPRACGMPAQRRCDVRRSRWHLAKGNAVERPIACPEAVAHGFNVGTCARSSSSSLAHERGASRQAYREHGPAVLHGADQARPTARGRARRGSLDLADGFYLGVEVDAMAYFQAVQARPRPPQGLRRRPQHVGGEREDQQAIRRPLRSRADREALVISNPGRGSPNTRNDVMTC